jgi:hypothetical protein
VEDLPAVKPLIKSAGYSFNVDELLGGYDRIYANDPFGNRIEFMEPLSVTHDANFRWPFGSHDP